MVRPADLRKRKYEGKVDPETLAIQTRALKPLMVRGETLYFPAIATVEEKVKRLVEGEGVPTIQVRDYLNFGREMYELTRKFSGSTLRGEAQLRVNKWSGRGLAGTLLVKIAQLFGVSPLAFPTPTLDIMPVWGGKLRLGGYYPSPLYVKLGAFDWGWPNTLIASPFPVTRKMRFDQLGMFIQGGGGPGALLSLGIYDSDENTYPTKLLASTENLDAATMGFKKGDIDLTIEKGLYYLTVICNHAQIVGYIFPVILSPLGTWRGEPDLVMGKWSLSYPFGPLPDPFPEEGDMESDSMMIVVRIAELL